MASPTAVLRALAPRQSNSNSDGSQGVDIQTGNANLDEFLKLLANPFKSQFTADSVEAALATSLPLFLLITLGFSLIRPRHRAVYAPKLKLADEKHQPPPVGKGILAWIKPIATTREDQMVEKVGLDATIFLRFTRMLRNIFIVISVIGCGIMIPVNILDSNKSISTHQILAITTPQFVQKPSAYWSHVVCAWLFDIVVAYFLWHNYRKILRLRRQYFASSEYQNSLHARTVMITDIPQNLRSDEGLMRITDEVNPTGVAPRATVGRNVQVLPKLIEEYEENVKELESVLAKYLKNPAKLPAKRPTMSAPRKFKGDDKGAKVDAIDFLTERIKDLEQEIKSVRERIDSRDAMPYGFASWEEIEQAHAVAYTARKKHPQGTEIVLAPRPHDLIWDNLPLGKGTRRTKRIWHNIYVTILTLIWTPINACIAVFLSNLANLGLVWPGFQKSLEAHSAFWAIVQGVAAPALTSAVYLLLPTIFRRLSTKSGDTTRTSRERHVIHNLYAFFVFNNLIIFCIFSSVWYFIAVIISAKQGDQSVWKAVRYEHPFQKLLISLCDISPYWITWLLQRNLGAAIDLAQLLQLVWVWIAKTFMSPTPRQRIEWTAPTPFAYANYYNYFLFYATSALCFATLQPFVLPVTALYFVIDAWMKKYLLLYVFTTKYESGGQFWRMIYNRMVFATILANVVVGLIVKGGGSWIQIAALAPAPLAMLGFKFYCMRAFDDEMQYYARPGAMDQERLATGGKGNKTRQVASKFGHPALWKPLITPMVNANAKSVLGDIYHGRLETDNSRSGAYSEFALGDMAPSKPGTSKASDAPFDFVSEAQMDFANFKNRSDFRDELGGGLYGRPEDMVGSRSGTPQPHMNREGTWNSPPSTRASSASPSRGRDRSVPDVSRQTAYRSSRDSSMGDIGAVNMRDGSPAGFRGDEANSSLLQYAQGNPMTPPRRGQQLNMDRWRASSPQQHTGYGVVRQDVDNEPDDYDYERRQR